MKLRRKQPRINQPHSIGGERVDLTKVKEIKETRSIDEVNKSIEEDWILLRIVPNHTGLLFILGRARN